MNVHTNFKIVLVMDLCLQTVSSCWDLGWRGWWVTCPSETATTRWLPHPPTALWGRRCRRQGGELPSRLRRARGSALKFKGACLPANKARGGPGPRDQLRSPQKGRGLWRQMDIPHAGRGTSDLLPHSRLQRLFARRASSLGAAVLRTLPAGRGWPGRGCIRGIPRGRWPLPLQPRSLAPPRSFRERGPGGGPEPAERAKQREPAGQEDAALTPAPHPARSGRCLARR